MGSYINTKNMDILHKGFAYSSFYLSSSVWFEVDGAQLEKDDIMYFPAPIRVQQYFNQNLKTVVGFTDVSISLSIKFKLNHI